MTGADSTLFKLLASYVLADRESQLRSPLSSSLGWPGPRSRRALARREQFSFLNLALGVTPARHLLSFLTALPCPVHGSPAFFSFSSSKICPFPEVIILSLLLKIKWTGFNDLVQVREKRPGGSESYSPFSGSGAPRLSSLFPGDTTWRGSAPRHG